MRALDFGIGLHLRKRGPRAPEEMLQTLPGYSGDVQKNREEARALMQKAGYGPDKRLAVRISTRNLAVYRDPSAILIDQLKEIGIDAELDASETSTPMNTETPAKAGESDAGKYGNATTTPKAMSRTRAILLVGSAHSGG